MVQLPLLSLPTGVVEGRFVEDPERTGMANYKELGGRDTGCLWDGKSNQKKLR